MLDSKRYPMWEWVEKMCLCCEDVHFSSLSCEAGGVAVDEKD